MARSLSIVLVLSKGIIGAVTSLTLFACDATNASALAVQSPARVSALEQEVFRLAARINSLEAQLLQERRNAALSRHEIQAQQERLVALEHPSTTGGSESEPQPSSLSVSARMQVEAELRLAYQVLMRAIERLDVSAEEKAALKSSLRPSRALDRDNPWSVAKY